MLDSIISTSVHLLALCRGKNQQGVTCCDVTFIYVCVTCQLFDTRAGFAYKQKFKEKSCSLLTMLRGCGMYTESLMLG